MNTYAKKIQLMLALVLTIIVSACGASAKQTPTLDPAAVYTQVAATVQAGIMQTQAAMSSPTVAPTNTPSPTVAITPSITSSSLTPIPTLTQYIPSSGSTPPSATGDDLKWIADVSYPDCSVLSPGEEFVKTWKVQNSGTSTWTKDYYLLWTDIKNYDPNNYKKVVVQSEKKLGEEIKPGDQVELDMKIVAPDTNGVYKIFYVMMNPNVKYSAARIGFGESLWVLFVVNDTPATPITTCPTPAP
jgi:hypothetical protein